MMNVSPHSTCHLPVPEQVGWLEWVLGGYFAYYAVPIPPPCP